ncbi:hypothetical protein H2198_007203 [Neophaeococcomyces mojaviensis]|uniref:Uncharacterized protein n=1 Tax=Neophaeococcomyces mojaviensis TaxID=3383035 RepID=A0ACC3A0U3_9EURO|nr:hypothetical protein H2198_007203 [Knufia sp. JES_112]
MSSQPATSTADSVIESNVFGGFGAVLGYIGAEAATPAVFERLLWPQRFLSGFDIASAPWLAILMPMGGPLHKAALQCLDTAFTYGLFKGPQQGHMLGTSFFSQKSWTYTMHANDGAIESHTEPVRNSLWTGALSQMAIPVLETSPLRNSDASAEKRMTPVAPFRAKVAVSHLTLTSATLPERQSKMPLVSEAVDTPSLRIILGLFTTEATAICLSIALALSRRTLWSLFFLAPLFLRLLSALFSVHREPLVPHDSTVIKDERWQDFEIHCPSSEGSFMLITGPPSVVLQFFRHYGHPVRNRFRELLQLCIVVMYGCYFPIGLLCSVCWMPIDIQYAWLSYQIYVVLSMHLIRYTHSGSWASTQARIVQAFTTTSNGNDERSILFGQNREDAGLVKATLKIMYKNRYGEGKECMEQLLSRNAKV